MSLYMNHFTKDDGKRLLPFILGIVAFIYLAPMCVRTMAGVFNSTDSADFLMASTVWAVPQTYGYPLYIVLGHFLNLFPGELAVKMTVLLSALPSAITVTFTHLIIRRLTKRDLIAAVCSIMLLGTLVFLTEATITKGYALTAMFLTISYYCYICEWKYRTVVFLGLSVAMHVMVLGIAFFWILADRRWRLWLNPKVLLTLIAIGILPYVLVPILMVMDTPRYLVGPWSFSNIKGFWTGTGNAIIGMLSVNDAPKRWWFLGQLLVVSFGLGIVPLLRKQVWQFKKKHIAVLIAGPIFILWYVATCLDMQVWPYLAVVAPFIIILAGTGLNYMHDHHSYILGGLAIVLVFVNGFFLNANQIEQQDGEMLRFQTSLRALPDNAVVVVEPGPYSLNLFYTITLGKKLVPLIYPYMEFAKTMGTEGFDTYLHDKYGVTWTSTIDGVQWCLDNDRPVYYLPQVGSPLWKCFNLTDSEDINRLNRIVGLTGYPPTPTVEVSHN